VRRLLSTRSRRSSLALVGLLFVRLVILVWFNEVAFVEAAPLSVPQVSTNGNP